MNKTKKRPAEKSKAQTPMKGADVLVRCLENEGVDTLFAYPGGQSIDLHDSFSKSKKIRVILPRHEQGCGFMAQGYARATGKVGVCMATSGPGAMNLLTTISDAFMDSIPMVAITGQVFQKMIGKSAFQETDVFGMTLPVVKHSYLVLEAEKIPQVIKEAFKIAKTGRPGPVVIDLPKDVQQKVFVPDFDAEPDLPGLSPVPHADDANLEELLDLISKSKQPVVYAGGGVISADASKELRQFTDMLGLPVATTLMGMGVADPFEKKNLYWFGMHGTYVGNRAVFESDLLIAVGARFSDRITGTVSKFAPHATIVHIDIDVAEENKNVKAALPITSDVKYALARLIQLAKKPRMSKPNLKDWLEKIEQWKAKYNYPFAYRNRKHITAQEAIATLYNVSKGKLTITTGVGQHQMWTPQNYIFTRPRQFLSSLGAGTMGFGLPAALGAKVALPGEEVVDIDGDGSFQMNIQEMATAVAEHIPVKVLLINNQFLGMVMQWQDLLFKSNYANTVLSIDKNNIGGPENLKAIYPDYCKIAEGYEWEAARVYKKEDLKGAIEKMLASKRPYLLEVITEHDEHVLPFIPPGKSAEDIITIKPAKD